MTKKRVLFLRFSSLGDVILSNYCAMRVKQKHPEWELTWLADSVYAPLVRSQPWVDAVMEWDRGKTGNIGFLNILRQVRRSKFDILIDMHSSDRTTFFSCVCGIPVRYGSIRKKLPLKVYTNMVYPELTDGALEKCSSYLAAGPLSERAASFFRDSAPARTLILAIGASYEKKHWPLESWLSFTKLASGSGYRLVLVGSGRDEEEMAGGITARLAPGSVINTVGKLSITELVQVIGQGDFCVSGDTGPLHIARALGVPAIGMFGPSMLGKGYMESLHKVFFSSCAELGCARWQCPKPCLETITPDSIMSCVDEYFAEKESKK